MKKQTMGSLSARINQGRGFRDLKIICLFAILKMKKQNNSSFTHYPKPFSNDRITSLTLSLDQSESENVARANNHVISFRNENRKKLKKQEWFSDTSLLTSDISVFSTSPHESLQENMRHLEVALIQQILALREEKLDLMEEYNKALSDRFRAQRQLTRIQKKQMLEFSEVEDFKLATFQLLSSQEEDIFDDAFNSDNRVEKQQQSTQSKMISMEPQPNQSNQQLEKIRFQCSRIEREIANLDLLQKQRIQRQAPKKSNNSIMNEKLAALKMKRAEFFKKAMQNQQISAKQELLQMLEDNKALQLQLSRPKSRLSTLKAAVAREEEQKILFFHDLKQFKTEVQRARQINVWLRSQI